MTEPTNSTTTPNSVLLAEQEHVSKKQKQEAPAVVEEKPKKSFKAIANLVVAMKRFQGEHAFVKQSSADHAAYLRIFMSTRR